MLNYILYNPFHSVAYTTDNYYIFDYILIRIFYTLISIFLFFFFNDTAPTEIYTLPLHDALPISIDYEIRWQIEEIEDGRRIQQATVLFDPDTGETRSMRTKEDAADYRYFPDPDLPPLVVAPEWVEQVRADMPELPRAMAARFVEQYALPEYDATTLTQSQAMAAYFEDTARACNAPKLASNWIMGEISRMIQLLASL